MASDYEAWLLSGDTGISSKTIFAVMRGMTSAPRHASVPLDPSDFGRCYRLLKQFPEWRRRLPEVAALFPEWGPLVREWDRMTALFEEESPGRNCPKLYELMQQLRMEGRECRKVAAPAPQ